MRLKLYGIFAEDFGSEIFIDANTVADAVEGFTRQVDFYTDKLLDDRPIIRVVGFNTLESLYEKTEQEVIHLVPAMIGGGGGFGRILIGAAFIGLSFIPGLGQIGQLAIASTLFTMGTGLVLSGAMQLFMKAPKMTNNEDEGSKYLGVGDNTVVIGTPIALQWGRGPATGHVLAINVDSSEMITGTFPANPT